MASSRLERASTGVRMAGENRKKTTTDLQRVIKGLTVGLKRMYAKRGSKCRRREQGGAT
ncbi:BQ5605_C004g02658 [Microbotryum silenes-dioicae]|uniref:BQ5605_C004g02658 protein n=1 Tax=Microbotryum silenes-dioicae TaxID=796604 RepID=A0A2X0MCW3_9BASI|nr:BQ5605_C004g02658 [Microbotryum silenes-dioicae]